MLKKMEEPAHFNVLNKSALKAMRNNLFKNIPYMEKIFEDLVPKKSTIYTSKAKTNETKFEIFSHEGQILFI